MSQTFLLAKHFFKSGLIVNKKSTKDTGKYFSMLFIAIVFACIGFFGAMAYFKLLEPQIKNKEALLPIALVLLSLITIVITFFQMHSTLFRCKDYDFFASAPVKTTSVVGAKLLSLYLTNLLIDACVMLPILIYYVVVSKNFSAMFMGLIATIFASWVPILFVTFIGALVAIITAKSKHGNTISSVVYIVFFLAYSASFTFLFTSNNALASITEILPYYWFFEQAVYNNDWLQMLWFVLINFAGIIIIILFVSLVYSPLNQMKQNTYSKEYQTSKQNHTVLSVRHILFKKELFLIIKNPVYLLNTYMIPVIFLILGLINIGVIGKAFSERSPEVLESALRSLEFGQVITAILMGGISCTTYAAFSVEGENFYNLYAYPLDKNEIIRAKIKASIIPLVLMYAFCGALFCVLVGIFQGFEGIKFTTWFNIIAFPGLGTAVTALIGTLCGLKWIKLDFQDMNDVVKKSKALVFTMIFSALISIAVIAVFIACRMFLYKNKTFVEAMAISGIIVGLYAIVIAIFSVVVHKVGPRLFDEVRDK